MITHRSEVVQGRKGLVARTSKEKGGGSVAAPQEPAFVPSFHPEFKSKEDLINAWMAGATIEALEAYRYRL